MGMNRVIDRKLVRSSYALLSRRWRLRRKSQAELDALGVPPVERIGCRPPLSMFARACRGRDPVEIAQGNLAELLEYLASPHENGGLELSWRDMRAPTPSRREGLPAGITPVDRSDSDVPTVPMGTR